MAFDTLVSMLKNMFNIQSTSFSVCLMLLIAGFLLNLSLVVLGKKRGLSPAWWLLAPCTLLIAGSYNELASYQSMLAKLASASQETQSKHTMRGIVDAYHGNTMIGLGLIALSWTSAMSLAATHFLHSRTSREILKWPAIRAAIVGILSAATLVVTLLVRAYKPEMLIGASIFVMMLFMFPLILSHLIHDTTHQAHSAVTGICVTILGTLGFWGLAKVVLGIGKEHALNTHIKFSGIDDGSTLTKALELMHMDYTSLLLSMGVFFMLCVIALWFPSFKRVIGERTSRKTLAITLSIVACAVLLTTVLNMNAESMLTEVDSTFMRIALGG